MGCSKRIISRIKSGDNEKMCKNRKSKNDTSTYERYNIFGKKILLSAYSCHYLYYVSGSSIVSYRPTIYIRGVLYDEIN